MAVSIEPLYWVNFALVLVVGTVGYFLRRVVNSLDKLEEEVQALEVKVAVLIDRDRMQRLDDYEKGQGYRS